MQKIKLMVLVFVLASSQAFAMKCESNRGENHNDCDYRAYTHAQQIDLYASNCIYSDDDGFAGTFSIKSLTKVGDDKYTLNRGNEIGKIIMICGSK